MRKKFLVLVIVASVLLWFFFSSSLLRVLNALNLNDANFFFVRVCSVSYFVIVSFLYSSVYILHLEILFHCLLYIYTFRL